MTENRIEELEKRVQHLEERVKMLVEIADYEKHPFTYTALEYGLTESQINKIFALMDEVEDAIRSGKKPLNHSEFEDRVYEIVPSRQNDYHFAQDIVSSLNRTHQYQEVYQHMKRSGMNLR